MQDHAAGATPELAESWKRLVAGCIDLLIVLVPSFLIGLVVYAVLVIALITTADQSGGFLRRGFFDVWQISFLVLALVVAAFNALYYALFHSRRGQTLGKMASRIKVVDAGGRGSVSFGRALLRWLVPFGPIYLIVPLASIGFILAFAWLLLDVLWPLWDPKRQAIHDKVAKTLVVEAPVTSDGLSGGADAG